MNKVDVFAIQETHCRSDAWAPKLHGFNVYSVASGLQGEVGIALAIKSVYTASVLAQSKHWIIAEIRMENGIFIVANVYFPSGGLNHSVIRNFEHCLNRYTMNITRSRVIILGDFNRLPAEVDQLCWRWSAPVTRLSTRGSPGTFHGFRPQMEPSAIDHILFGPSAPAHLKAKVLRGWSDSDHWPVLVSFPTHLGEPPRPVPKTVYSRTFSESSSARFLGDNRWNVLIDQLSDGFSVETATSLLLDTFNSIGRTTGLITEQTGKSDKAQCLSHSTKCALRHRTRALNTYLENGSREALNNYNSKKALVAQLLLRDKKRRWTLGQGYVIQRRRRSSCY